MVSLPGCGQGENSSVSKVASDLALRAGSSNGQPSDRFTIRGRGVRVEYRLSDVPAVSPVTFTVLRDRGAAGFAPVSSVVRQITASSLKGSFDTPLVSGDYRIRLDADASWTASIFDLK